MEDKKVFELDDNLVLNKIKTHKWTAAIASVAVVSLIAGALVLSIVGDDTKALKTASSNGSSEKIKADIEETTTSTTAMEESSIVTAPNTTKPQLNTHPEPDPEPTPPPTNPSNLRLDGVEVIGTSSNPGTYNVHFSWDSNQTSDVRYCVSTTSVGVDSLLPTLEEIAEAKTVDNNFDANCNFFSSDALIDSNYGFGLVFKKDTNYTFRVTAYDLFNQKSETVSLTWRLP